MFQAECRPPSEARRGVILMVVLILLTLFAIVGLSFALYAGSESQVAQMSREAEVPIRPDAEPELLAAYFLGQLIYDADDTTGVFSALRGHSLARSMYGAYYRRPSVATDPDIPNTVPFNGMGRLHTQKASAPTDPLAYMNPFGLDDYQLINYMFHPEDMYPNGSSLLPVPFLRDPERANPNPTAAQAGGLPPWRTDPNQLPGPYVGGFNAPYTYPDLNNLYLGAAKADGTLLTPSFHRSWLFGPLGENNQNWWQNSYGKYLTLRPRPVDQLTRGQIIAYNATVPQAQRLPVPGPAQSIKPETLSPVQLLSLRSLVQALQTRGQLLPYPEDDLGDVKNLVGAPGGNDSIWIDLGYPVLTAPNGQKYKPLFAPLILDLDNRINLNVHGNIRGGAKGNRFFVANQGWGPWTVDVSQILNYQATQTTPPEEWKQLFYGLTIDPSENRVVGAPVQPGRYGLNTIVANDTTVIPPPHFYAPVDYDECDPTGQRTVAISLQNGTNCFPAYPPTGFDNFSAAERNNHPSRYNVFQPIAGQQRRFPVSDMEALLRFGDTGSPFLTSELLRLCPHNFCGDFYGDPMAAQRRRLVTVRSFDVERPGVTPWLTQYHGQIQTQGNYSLPYGGAPAFSFQPPGPPPSPQQLLQDPNDFRVAATGANQIGTDWRAATAALGRLDLNRPLPPYPTPGGNGVINDGDPTTLRQFQAAELARQQFAEDIYVRLINVTGVYNPFLDPQSDPTRRPEKPDILALQSLAQLAVNIVDLIDEDDYSTPFHWGAIGHPNFQKSVEIFLAPTPPWVFGVEMPHVLINEAYAQYTIQNKSKATQPHPITVETWVELYNPLSPDPNHPPFNGNAYLNSGVGPTRGYRLILAKPFVTTLGGGGSTDDYLRLPTNPRGNPYNPQKGPDYGIFQVAQNQPAIVDFVDKPRPIPHFVNTSSGGAGPQGYFVVGPTGAQGPAMPAGAQVYTRPEMTYTLPDKDPYILKTNSGLRPAAPTVVLQRLACPYLPHNPLPNDPEFPGLSNPNRPVNPYITIDYFSDVNKETNQAQQNQVYIRSDNEKPLDQKAASEGRRQPFAGNSTQKLLQTSGTKPMHSFFQKNDNAQSNFNWLVHLDRQLISPMELMHVAAVKPALLTQEFIDPSASSNPGHMQPYNHRVPWYDEDLNQLNTGNTNLGITYSHRLHRLFEFVATRSRAAGLEAPGIQGRLVPGANDQIRVNRLSWLTASGSLAAIKVGDVLVLDKGLNSHENVRVTKIFPATPADFRVQLFNPLIKTHNNPLTVELTTMGERVPGKININTIWDMQTFQALANPTISNLPPPSSINADPWGIPAMFANLIQQRSPGLLAQGSGTLTAADQPLLGMAAGHYSSPTVPFYPVAAGYGTSGVNHTLLEPIQLNGKATSMRLMQVPFQTSSNTPQHPFVANQLLTRLFNNVTTRSNVFAVWVTVGFFEVIDDAARPVKLGAEIGKSENRQVRHRMFSVVDRTALTVPSPIGSLVGTLPASGLHSVKMDQVTNSITIGPLPPVGPPVDPALNRAVPQQIVWTLQPNDIIVVGEGTANQETVTVAQVDVQNRVLTANFARPHATGETVTLHVVPGNPGPTTRFDPRDPIYEEVVPYLSIIE